MLILTRRIGETLMIGENAEITVTVLGVKGNQVRLGVVADKDIPVHREEIFERYKRGDKPPIKNLPSVKPTRNYSSKKSCCGRPMLIQRSKTADLMSGWMCSVCKRFDSAIGRECKLSIAES